MLLVVILVVLSSFALLWRSCKIRNLALVRVGGLLPEGLTRHIAEQAELFSRGFAVLRHAGAVRRFLELTMVIWSLETVAVYVMLLAFQIKTSFLIAATLLVVVNLSFVFPISPGNIGLVQALSILVLGTYGITKETALAFSLIRSDIEPGDEVITVPTEIVTITGVFEG